MTTFEKLPQPGPVFQNENGHWTFHIYPHGTAQEEGAWPDEQTAERMRNITHRSWMANGETYSGEISVLKYQSPVRSF
jgi:hypothetical protein